MSEFSASFDALPVETLLHIAEYADESSLWSLRAMNRAAREAADVALTPFLAEKRVVNNPPLVKEIYIPIDPIHATEDSLLTRALDIVSVSDRFERHLLAFPRSEHLLRRLVLEVRDDDSVSNWRYLRRFSKELQELDLHIFDRLWPQVVNHGTQDPTGTIISRAGRVLATDIWTRISHPPWAPFGALHTLRLCTTTRIPDHLAGISAYAPELRDLSLSCHWDFGLGHDSYDPLAIFYAAPLSFAKLKRLSVAATPYQTRQILSALLPSAPNLANLSIHVTVFDCADYEVTYGRIIQSITKAPRIQGLALYGDVCGDLLRALAAHTRKRLSLWSFRNLEALVLESTKTHTKGDGFKPWDTGYEEDEREAEANADYEFDERSVYPLMEDHDSIRVHLPALTHISWVNKRIDPRNGFPDFDPTELYEGCNMHSKSALWKFFDAYPSVNHVRFLYAYPTDPFSDPESYTAEGVYDIVDGRV